MTGGTKSGGKRGIQIKLAAVKRGLAQWLDQTSLSEETAPTTIALLETALDGYLAERAPRASDLAPAAANALDLIQPILRRAVQRRRVALRLNASRMAPAPAMPVNDEELANRLTEMLNLLDALRGPLPQDDPLRQFIDEAAEPLGTLLGWFAGAIDGPVPPAAEGHPPARDPDTPLEPYPIEEWS